MDKTMKVSVKAVLLTALLLLALAVAYLIGGSGTTMVLPAQGAASTTTQPDPGQERVLRMVGTGEATVVPDELTFTLTVTDKDADLERALADSSATMARVLQRLRDLGVRAADVQTTGLRMNPEYDYPQYGPRVLTGYRVTQQARVHVRELGKGGQVVSAAVGTGGNGVRATKLRLGVSDPDDALAEARREAVGSATAKAEQYAAAAGETLGDVLALKEVGSQGGVRRDRLGYQSLRLAARDVRALPLRAGRDELSVKVEVRWALAE